MRARAALALLLATAAAAPATAQVFDQGRVETRAFRSPDMAAQAGHGIASENLFGLTLGSDIDGAGSRSGAVEINGRIGARAGHYAAFGSKLEFAHGATDLLSVAASPLAGREVGVAQTCDLGNFARQLLKLKLGVEF